MIDFLTSSSVWGAALTLAAFALGTFLHRKTRAAWCNPLLWGSIFVIIVLSALKVPYQDYKRSAEPLTYLLFPATVSLLPKSVTTAIGVDVSTELGGIPALTTAVIILTGICGNLLAVGLCRLLRITNPIARGIAIGTCSHTIGTSKALEIGPVEGALSSLSIAVAGILTAVLCPLAVSLLSL